MNNKLSDLNNYLFEELERLNDDELTEEQMANEIEKSKAITNVARAIIDNANTCLKASQFLNENGYNTLIFALYKLIQTLIDI